VRYESERDEFRKAGGISALAAEVGKRDPYGLYGAFYLPPPSCVEAFAELLAEPGPALVSGADSIA